MMEKLPPIEKIYEAYSAIADKRVDLKEDHGEVFSSDRKKCYTVSFDGNVYSSNDNSTYWQGYAGYPVIAVLFLQGKLPLNEKIASCFADVSWNGLNQQFRRDYAAAAEYVMKQRQLDREAVEKEAEAVYEALKQLDIVIRRGKLRPVK